MLSITEGCTHTRAINIWLGCKVERVGVSSRVRLIGGCQASREGKLLTCCRILLRQSHQRVASSRLVVHQGFGRDVANDLIALSRLHLHSDILQDLVVQGVGAVKLKREGENSKSLKLLTVVLTLQAVGAWCQLLNPSSLSQQHTSHQWLLTGLLGQLSHRATD